MTNVITKPQIQGDNKFPNPQTLIDYWKNSNTYTRKIGPLYTAFFFDKSDNTITLSAHLYGPKNKQDIFCLDIDELNEENVKKFLMSALKKAKRMLENLKSQAA